MDAGAGNSSKHFWVGVRDALALPAWIVSLALMGIGPMARDIGFPALAAILSTLLMWAGPAQMIFFGMLSAGASLTAVAIAVTLSAIRLLPMAVSIIPLLRHSKPSHGTLIYVSHLVAVTAWVEGIRRLPSMPPEERLPYFLGFGTACMILATILTGLGYFLAGTVPLDCRRSAAVHVARIFYRLTGRRGEIKGRLVCRRCRFLHGAAVSISVRPWLCLVSDRTDWRHARIFTAALGNGEGGSVSTFTETFGAFAPYMVLLVAGILPNEVWRWMAVWLSRGLDENSAIFEWVRMVSTCLVAGVVAQLLIEPSGALAAVPGPLRLAAGIMAVAGFFISRRRVLAGVLSGVLTIGISMAVIGY